MNTTTDVPTGNSDAAEAMRRLLANASITEDAADMLIYGAGRGIVDPAEVPSLQDLGSLREFLEVTGLEQAWDEDQERRGVPITCPPWCTTNHAAAPGGGSVVTPWEGIVSHATELAAGEHVSVDYVQDQVHPEGSREGREYVTIWTSGDGPIELSPVDLTAAAGDFGSTLRTAVECLAEIQAGQEPTTPQGATE